MRFGEIVLPLKYDQCFLQGRLLFPTKDIYVSVLLKMSHKYKFLHLFSFQTLSHKFLRYPQFRYCHNHLRRVLFSADKNA